MKVYPTIFENEDGINRGEPCEEYFDIQELSDIVDEDRLMSEFLLQENLLEKYNEFERSVQPDPVEV